MTKEIPCGISACFVIWLKEDQSILNMLTIKVYLLSWLQERGGVNVERVSYDYWIVLVTLLFNVLIWCPCIDISYSQQVPVPRSVVSPVSGLQKSLRWKPVRKSCLMCNLHSFFCEMSRSVVAELSSWLWSIYCCNYLFHARAGPGLVYNISDHCVVATLGLLTSDCQRFLNQSRMCLYNWFTTFCQRWLNWNK